MKIYGKKIYAIFSLQLTTDWGNRNNDTKLSGILSPDRLLFEGMNLKFYR
jgi:hypothetical protein